MIPAGSGVSEFIATEIERAKGGWSDALFRRRSDATATRSPSLLRTPSRAPGPPLMGVTAGRGRCDRTTFRRASGASRFIGAPARDRAYLTMLEQFQCRPPKDGIVAAGPASERAPSSRRTGAVHKGTIMAPFVQASFPSWIVHPVRSFRLSSRLTSSAGARGASLSCLSFPIPLIALSSSSFSKLNHVDRAFNRIFF